MTTTKLVIFINSANFQLNILLSQNIEALLDYYRITIILRTTFSLIILVFIGALI